jgi:chondroitin 4-sulfotransferase 11
MIVSTERKFLFVHIQRTGGGSVSRLLRRNVPDARRFMMPHAHASDALRRLGPAYHDYYSFAFVRNPWDRMVSWFTMLKRQVHKTRHRWSVYKFAAATAGFEAFLNATEVRRNGRARYSLAFTQSDYLTDESGYLIVNDVFRLENMEADCRRMAERCGFSFTAIPHNHRTRHAHYSTFYTPETRQIVAARFAADIERFGYTFNIPE